MPLRYSSCAQAGREAAHRRLGTHSPGALARPQAVRALASAVRSAAAAAAAHPSHAPAPLPALARAAQDGCVERVSEIALACLGGGAAAGGGAAGGAGGTAQSGGGSEAGGAAAAAAAGLIDDGGEEGESGGESSSAGQLLGTLHLSALSVRGRRLLLA